MGDTLAVARITSMEAAPAVWSERWLPDVEAFPELMEARAEYQRRLAAWQVAGERRRDLEARIEVKAGQRQAALRDAYARGESEPNVKGAGEKLTAELAEAKEHSRAAMEAFRDHINYCIGLVIEHRDEWQAEIEAFQGSVDGEVQALLEQAAQLRAKRDQYARLAHWVERTVRGGEMPAEHFPYSDIPAPLSGDDDARTQEAFERSYAGGLAPQRRASEAEARSIEQGVLSSQHQQPITPTETVEVELNDLDDEDLVDWLMSCGGFDGNPKPTTAQVIAAAEDDPEMAQRLMQAERVAGGDAVRQDLLDRLGEITNGKVRA